MSGYGQIKFGVVGSGISVSADGSPVAKIAGAQVAWTHIKTITLAGGDATQGYRTFKDYDVVEAGEKYIRYGTVLARITAAADATAIGKYIPLVGTGVATQYSTLGYNADATLAVSTSEGDVFLVNRSIHENDPESDYPEVIDGGRCYRRRILTVGYGDGTVAYPDAAADAADMLALGLPVANLPAAALFKTALPQIYFVNEGNAPTVSS